MKRPLAIALLCFVPSLCLATITKYVDENGVIHFETSSGVVKDDGKFKIEYASPAQRNHVQGMLGDTHTISKIFIIKSSSHDKAYYLGARFKTENEGEVDGFWLIYGTKNAPSLLYSLDEKAFKYSRMGMADRTKARASMDDVEAKELQQYLLKSEKNRLGKHRKDYQ
ncbi:DUF4124 domain-containing protein [bacterium]|nr:DUF4124 domain-containing protein [bacterium]